MLPLDLPVRILVGFSHFLYCSICILGPDLMGSHSTAVLIARVKFGWYRCLLTRNNTDNIVHLFKLLLHIQIACDNDAEYI